MSLLFDQNLSRRPPALLAADFPALSAALGPPPKVVWLRLGNGPTRDVAALLRSRASDVSAFLADPAVGVLELP